MTQLPTSQRRQPPVPKHLKRVRPKTYSVAVYLVFAVILLQVVMLISVFWLRAMVVPVDVHPPRAQVNTSKPPPTTTVAINPATHPAKPAETNSTLSRLPSLENMDRHAALLSVPRPSDALAQIGSLNEEAQLFMRQHDLQSAAEALVKAEDIDPRNPTTLKNLAETTYLMDDAARSKTYWQRLVDLGPGVGTVYAVARDHVLLLGSTHDADTLREPSTFPRAVYVDSVEKTPVETLDGAAQFHVRAVLKRKNPNMPDFDQKKLQPYVIFYQQMTDGTLVPDLGQRKGSFDDTFLFWGGQESEPFGVDYVMPIPGTPGPNNAPQGEYYGFVIGIYYDKDLQDARSEPSDLILREPLPQQIE